MKVSCIKPFIKFCFSNWLFFFFLCIPLCSAENRALFFFSHMTGCVPLPTVRLSSFTFFLRRMLSCKIISVQLLGCVETQEQMQCPQLVYTSLLLAFQVVWLLPHIVSDESFLISHGVQAGLNFAVLIVMFECILHFFGTTLRIRMLPLLVASLEYASASPVTIFTPTVASVFSCISECSIARKWIMSGLITEKVWA